MAITNSAGGWAVARDDGRFAYTQNVPSKLLPKKQFQIANYYITQVITKIAITNQAAPSTVRPLARDPRVLIGWPFPLGFGLDGRLLLARRGRVYV